MIYAPLYSEQSKNANEVEFLAPLQGLPQLNMTNTHLNLSMG